MKSTNKRKLIFLSATALLITTTGILFHQSFLRMLPLYISLFINLLQTDINRYASLIGAFNAVIYSAVYYYYGLFAMAAYALLFSAPLQLITFFNWRRKSYRNSTHLRRLTFRQRISISLFLIISFAVLYLILSKLNSAYILLDNATTIFGVLVSLLMLMRYEEYSFLMIPQAVLNLALYISMLPQKPEQITFVVYAIYLCVCSFLTFHNAHRLYKLQH